MKHRLSAAIAALTLPLTGCAVAAIGTAGAVGITAVQDKSIGEAVDDATLSTEIKTKLLSENSAKFSEVDVEVTNGLVLLSGRVNYPEERVRAEGIAWSSKLTRDVANEIRIEPPGGFFANVNDEIITGRVRARLIGSSTVKSVNFNVETYNGVVYLMGLARTPEELKKAAEEAARAGGVKQVVSYVRIRDAAPIAAPPAQTIAEPSPPYQEAPNSTYDTVEDAPLEGVEF